MQRLVRRGSMKGKSAKLTARAMGHRRWRRALDVVLFAVRLARLAEHGGPRLTRDEAAALRKRYASRNHLEGPIIGREGLAVALEELGVSRQMSALFAPKVASSTAQLIIDQASQAAMTAHKRVTTVFARL